MHWTQLSEYWLLILSKGLIHVWAKGSVGVLLFTNVQYSKSCVQCTNMIIRDCELWYKYENKGHLMPLHKFFFVTNEHSQSPFIHSNKSLQWKCWMELFIGVNRPFQWKHSHEKYDKVLSSMWYQNHVEILCGFYYHYCEEKLVFFVKNEIYCPYYNDAMASSKK